MTETYKLDKALDSFNFQQVQSDLLDILERVSDVVIDMATCN